MPQEETTNREPGTDAPFRTNRSGIAAPKLSQADGKDAEQAMEKQESKPAFQLSHSHDYYGLYNLIRDTDSEGKAISPAFTCCSNIYKTLPGPAVDPAQTRSLTSELIGAGQLARNKISGRSCLHLNLP
jgi:hypothetical protein